MQTRNHHLSKMLKPTAKTLKVNQYMWQWCFNLNPFVDIPMSMLRLVRNPVYVITCLGACMELIIVSGFVVFLPKYLETQFSLGKSQASVFTGTLFLINKENLWFYFPYRLNCNSWCLHWNIHGRMCFEAIWIETQRRCSIRTDF